MKNTIFILSIAIILFSACKYVNKGNINQVPNGSSKNEIKQPHLSKNIRQLLELLPNRYLTFDCEAIEQELALKDLDIVDIENHYLCIGQFEDSEPIPGVVCFSLKSFPYKNGADLLVVTNEKFDGVCTDFDHFFLIFSNNQWTKISIKELFKVDVRDFKLYYPEGKIPELFQNDADISVNYLIKLNQYTNSLQITLSICDFFEEGEVDAVLIDALWSDLKVLEFIWEENEAKFISKQ